MGELATRAIDRRPGQLLAILFADIVESSRIMREDQALALTSIEFTLRQIGQIVGDCFGFVCGLGGDGVLAAFSSAADALECALRIQAREHPPHGCPAVIVRIGVHLGDAFVVDNQLLGDSVNVAARIQCHSAPGGILISRPMYEAVRSSSVATFRSCGTPELKNLSSDLELFAVEPPARPAGTTRGGRDPGKPRRPRAPASGQGLRVLAGGLDPLLPTREPPASFGFSVGLLPTLCAPNAESEAYCGDIILDFLSRMLTELELVSIDDYRFKPTGPGAPGVGPGFAGPDILLRCRVLQAGGRLQVSVAAMRAEDGRVIWTHKLEEQQDAFNAGSGRRIDEFVSHTADAILTSLVTGRHIRDPAAHGAAKTAIGAVHRLLTMTDAGLDRIEADLLDAHRLAPRPVFLAWLAYLATFRVGERYGVRDTALEEQARAYARQALEAEPGNSLVLGLVSHVYSYIFREFSFAEDLVTRAIEANPFRAISWDSASLLYSYTGRPERALDAALNARRLGRNSPYRYLYDGACCVAAAVSGQFEQAIRFGECSMAMQPSFKAVLRYLAACYGHVGQVAEAESAMQRLILLEPDLSVERIYDRSYPVPSQNSARLIASGLSKVGLPQRS
jgi:adenylate cyclase